MACTSESHADLKRRDPLLVAAGRYAGRQEDGDGGWLALYDCPNCGSTLALDERTVMMWTAIREAGTLAAAGDVEGACCEIARAGELARSIASSLEWRAQQERARLRRLELERGGVVLAVVP